MNFFVWIDEQQQGPFDEETIQKMVSEGQITHETLLCLEGGDLDWTPAKELFPPTEWQQIEADSAVIPQSGPKGGSWEERYQNQQYDAPVASHTLVENTDDGTRLEIRLTSGLELKIKTIQLYDEIILAEINSKRAIAIQ
jgi:hypothetical protein